MSLASVDGGKMLGCVFVYPCLEATLAAAAQKLL